MVQTETQYMHALSIGAGLNSIFMYRLYALGILEKKHPKIISFFADTGNEPDWVYEALDIAERDHGDVIPIRRVTAGNLAEDWFNGHDTGREENAMPATMPFHILNPDGSKGHFAHRTCTARYKLEPLRKAMRMECGLQPGERVMRKGVKRLDVVVSLGICVDEAHRVTESKEIWQTNHYPLVYDRPTRRGECAFWLQEHQYPVPKRSACWMCPFHSDREWLSVRENPDAWAKAVAFDKRIRTDNQFVNSRAKLEKPLRGIPFLHASLKPLDEVEFKTGTDPDQVDMFGNDCSGVCGV